VILGSILTILKAHNWRPTVFFLFTLWFGAFALGLSQGLNPLWYAFTFVSLGSAFFGGMFMLTDPVTSPTSNYGKAMIGIIAGIVVLIIRTQTSLPEGMVYGIAVANLASPLIDKYTVGLTHQFLKQRYALLSGMMVFAIGVTVLPTFATSEISSSSPSSSEPVVIPYATYRGTHTSYFYDEQDEPIELIVDVGVDRSFNLVKIDIIQGISTSGYAPNWQASGQAILNAYLAMDVATLLSLNPLDMPSNLVITGSSITTNRLLKALQNAFDGVQVLSGSATSYAYDEADTPDTTNAKVYVDESDVVIGLALTGKLATSQPYLGIVEEKLTSIQDYYLGMTAMDILALGNQGPLYPDFNPMGTGATISFTRIYQAIREAIGTAYGS
jgi:hypothetical protein